MSEDRRNRQKAVSDNPKLAVTFYQRRPYTVAIARVDGMTGVGVAKVSGKDRWRPALGKEIAQGRAIHNIAKQVVGEGRAWFVTEICEMGGSCGMV